MDKDISLYERRGYGNFESLLEDDATETIERKANEQIKKLMLTRYTEKTRSKSKGPGSYGQALSLKEDYYAFTFLYQFRRGFLFEQDYYGDDSNNKSEFSEDAP